MTVKTDFLVVLEPATSGSDAASVATSKLMFTSGRSWRTAASDNPANTEVQARVLQVRFQQGSTSWELFGAVRGGGGEVELWNGDRALDVWSTYGWWGRWVRVIHQIDGEALDLDSVPVAQQWVYCISSHVEFDGDVVRVKLLDALELLDKPLLDEAFAGDGTSTEGPEELKDVAKPIILGSVAPTPVIQTDAQKLIYHVSETASLTPTAFVAYDGGVAFDRGDDYASVAEMEAEAPAPGEARFLVGGYVEASLGTPIFTAVATS